jgi:hypothetical protein
VCHVLELALPTGLIFLETTPEILGPETFPIDWVSKLPLLFAHGTLLPFDPSSPLLIPLRAIIPRDTERNLVGKHAARCTPDKTTTMSTKRNNHEERPQPTARAHCTALDCTAPARSA